MPKSSKNALLFCIHSAYLHSVCKWSWHVWNNFIKLIDKVSNEKGQHLISNSVRFPVYWINWDFGIQIWSLIDIQIEIIFLLASKFVKRSLNWAINSEQKKVRTQLYSSLISFCRLCNAPFDEVYVDTAAITDNTFICTDR